MFTHVVVGSDDLAASKRFYDAIFATLGLGPAVELEDRIFYFSKTGNFGVIKPIDGEPATHANGGTIGFAIDSTEQGDAWHAAGLANGGTTCEDPPGIRDGRFGPMYLAYLRDPTGNKICVMKRMG